jgi:hypothetical protein
MEIFNGRMINWIYLLTTIPTLIHALHSRVFCLFGKFAVESKPSGPLIDFLGLSHNMKLPPVIKYKLVLVTLITYYAVRLLLCAFVSHIIRQCTTYIYIPTYYSRRSQTTNIEFINIINFTKKVTVTPYIHPCVYPVSIYNFKFILRAKN